MLVPIVMIAYHKRFHIGSILKPKMKKGDSAPPIKLPTQSLVVEFGNEHLSADEYQYN